MRREKLDHLVITEMIERKRRRGKQYDGQTRKDWN